MNHNKPADADSPIDECVRDGDASARGILQCLRMLSDEAATLGLPRTLEALRRALDACHAESAPAATTLGDATTRPPPGAAIH